MTASRSVTSPPRLRGEQRLDHAATVVGGLPRAADEDRVACALPPFRCGRAGRQQNGSIRKRSSQFAPDGGARIVDDRRVAGEQVGEVDRFTKHRSVPEGHLVGASEDLHHVVAGTAEETLERELERHRAGTAEAGTDELDCHAPIMAQG